MNRFVIFLVALVVIGALIISVFPIKNQLELDSIRADSIAKQEAAAIESQYNEIKQSETDTSQSLAAVSPEASDTNLVGSRTADSGDSSKQNMGNKPSVAAEKIVAQAVNKPVSAKPNEVVASNPKQLAEQRLANKSTPPKTNTATSAVKKTTTAPNNKAEINVKNTATATNTTTTTNTNKAEIRYKITIACFADAKREADLRKEFKLKTTDPIKVAKHPSNNCWRYMVGNYSNSADAFKKLSELRKYDKDCQVVQVTTKANKETVEIYKEGQK